MVAADEDGGVRGNLSAGVVLPEGIHGAVARWDVQALQVVLVPHGLEIAATYEEVDFGVVGFLQLLKGSVHILQVAVHAPFHRYLHPRSLR